MMTRNNASGRAAQDWPAVPATVTDDELTAAFDEIDARRPASGWREPDAEKALTEKLTAATNQATAAQLVSGLRAKVRSETLAEAFALATVLEIPWPGHHAPMQLRRSHGHADRWAICDRLGRRWYPQGWMYEPSDDRLCDGGRFTLAEALPLARDLVADDPAQRTAWEGEDL